MGPNALDLIEARVTSAKRLSRFWLHDTGLFCVLGHVIMAFGEAHPGRVRPHGNRIVVDDLIVDSGYLTDPVEGWSGLSRGEQHFLRVVNDESQTHRWRKHNILRALADIRSRRLSSE